MSQNNQVVLIGNISNSVSDTLRIENALASCTVLLELETNQEKQIFECRFFNRQAEVMADFGKTGALISIMGSLDLKSGTPVILCSQFEFLGFKRKAGANA